MFIIQGEMFEIDSFILIFIL